MKDTVLAVDIGTSSIKAGIISRKGELLSWNRAAYSEIAGFKKGWTTDLWPETLGKLLSQMDSVSQASAAVVSGNGPTLIPVDQNGNYLNDPYLWADRRKLIRKGIDSFYLPSVLWMKENSPQYYRNASFFSSY